MTRQENILTLNEHLEHWKRLLSEKICDQSEGEKTIDALQNAIKALEKEPCEVSQGLVKDSQGFSQGFSQEPCEDAVSRQAVNEIINDAYYLKLDDGAALQESIHQLPSVTPQSKIGYISIDDVMAVFDDFMRGDVDEDNTETFLEMLKDKTEGSEE